MPEQSQARSDLWIAKTSHEPDSEGDIAMVVPAASEAEAAATAADWFTRHPDYADALPINNVFVAPWSNRTAYVVRCAADIAELQCCGGGSDCEYTGAEGHWATCDERPPGTGQLREDDDRGVT